MARPGRASGRAVHARVPGGIGATAGHYSDCAKRLPGRANQTLPFTVISSAPGRDPTRGPPHRGSASREQLRQVGQFFVRKAKISIYISLIT